jgi:hypothetical protein
VPLCYFAINQSIWPGVPSSREIKRWFGITPMRLQGAPELLSALALPGYG